MTSKDYKKIILDKIEEILKPRQFRKGGQTFKHSNGDLIYYVDLQSSKFSTATELKVTINIGIGSELLYKLEGKTITSYLRGHFSKRIGDYLSPAQDIWWTIIDAHIATYAAEEIASIIANKVLSEFDKIKSTQDLIELWLKGICFGLSDYQRQEYLVMLERAQQV